MRSKRRAEPEPLSALECQRVWHWQQRMLVFYTLAMLALIAAAVFLSFFGEQEWARVAAVVVIAVLVVVGGVVQFREGCPRCGAKLGRQARVLLPLKCRSCGVVFPRKTEKDADTRQP